MRANCRPSIVNSTFWARENARTIRESISREAWECVNELWLWLDARLVDPSRPVTVVRGERETEHRLRPGLRALFESLARRGDPRLAFASRVVLPGE